MVSRAEEKTPDTKKEHANELRCSSLSPTQLFNNKKGGISH